MGRGRHDTLGAPVDDPAGAGFARSAQVSIPLCAFDAEGSHVTVWRTNCLGGSGNHDANDKLNHIVYLHVYDGDGLDVLSECQRIGCPPFTLVAIKPACWNDDLTPWECPGLFADDAPFAGHAQDQLHLLEEEITPQVERECGKPNSPRICRTVAGYSLAGLFATWTALNSSAFSRIASASGSLWYPDFAHFVAERPLKRPIDCAYFSLGSKEAKTPEPTSAQRCNGNGRGRCRISQQGGTDAIRVEPRQPL